MAINLDELRARPLDPEVADEIDKFETAVEEYLTGDLSEDVFRVMRLNQGIYGQRQGGTNQMVRVKVPTAGHARQLESSARSPRSTPRGDTSRPARTSSSTSCSCVRPRVLRLSGRSASQPRGVRRHRAQRRRLPPCRACPFEVLDITPWARPSPTSSSATRAAPPPQVQVNFSGCATDCGQAMFNDVGISPSPARGRLARAGFKVFLAGGLGTLPPAQALGDFTSRGPAPTVEACLRTFDHYGNRDNKLRPA